MEIKEIDTVKDPLMELFLELPRSIYTGDPIWTPENEDIIRYSFMGGMGDDLVKIRPFIAVDGSQPLARCCAIIHPRAIDGRGKKEGWFGYFEALQGESRAAGELLDTVSNALRDEGCSVMVGPRSELMTIGLQTSGFQLPHTWMTPHNPPYYEDMLLDLGFSVRKELISLLLSRGTFRDYTANVEGYTIRQLDKNDPDREIGTYHFLNNTIFTGRDLFFPRTLEEDTVSLNAVIPLIDEELVLFAETKNGEPVGMMVCVPDLNQMLQEGKVDRARLISVGLLPEHRGKGVGTMMASHLKERLLRKGYVLLEGSWIQKDNIGPQALGQVFMAEPGRKFKLFERSVN